MNGSKWPLIMSPFPTLHAIASKEIAALSRHCIRIGLLQHGIRACRGKGQCVSAGLPGDRAATCKRDCLQSVYVQDAAQLQPPVGIQEAVLLSDGSVW